MGITAFNVDNFLAEIYNIGGHVEGSDIDKVIEWCSKSDTNANHVIKKCGDFLAKANSSTACWIIADLNYIRGMVYILKEKHVEAIQNFTVAIEQYPGDAPYFQRGIAYCQMGENEKAIKDFTSAIELAENENGDHYYYRGLAYQALGNIEMAQKDLTKALSFAKGN